MDTFLQKLYDAEMSKQAAANLDGFMKTLDVSDLEAFLSLSKEAVAGPVEAPLPSSLPQHRLDAKMKATAANLHLEHRGTPAKATSSDPNLSYQGVGLPTSGTTKKAADYAAEAGRVFAKTASSRQRALAKEIESGSDDLRARMKATRGKTKDADMDVEQAGSAFNQKMAASKSDMVSPADHVAGNIGLLRALTDTPQGPGGSINPELLARAKKNALIGGLVGGGAGALLGAGGSYAGGLRGLQTAPGALLGLAYGGLSGAAIGDTGTTRRWVKERGVHPGLFGGVKFTPEAAARYLDPVTAAKTTSEEARAAMIARAISATKGAPEHIKESAAKVVASEMSKLALLPTGVGAAIGAVRAPEGERGKGAFRGGAAGLGFDVGTGLGLLPAILLGGKYSASAAKITPRQNAALVGLGALGMLGGGALGAYSAHGAAARLAPYKHELKRASDVPVA